MNTKKMAGILEGHRKWLRNEGGSRADLSGAYLSQADLSQANLSRADLSRADLSQANLSRADLSQANLGGADLSRANLSRANLSRADLNGADLNGAEVDGTCLDPALHTDLRRFVRACRPLRTGGRIVYRTAQSQYIGSMQYEPGHTYTAPILSFDSATACHPGIYAGSLEWMRDDYPNKRLVCCYVRDGDWVISAKGAIRCKKLRILGYVG